MQDLPAATPARILALDVGRKRIGLAVLDALGLAPHGLPTLERTQPRKDLARLTALAREHGVGLLLVGLPVRLSGQDSAMTEHVRGFAAELGARSGLPVKLWDERLTSVEAEDRLRARGRRIDRASGHVDQMAAIVLLEDYLLTHYPPSPTWPENVDPPEE